MRDHGGRDDLLAAASSFAPGRAILLILLIAMTAGSASAQQPNVVSNSDFDVDLSDWTIEKGPAVWSSEDADGDPGSGSALLDAESSAVYLSQCVAVEADESYQERVKVRYVAPEQDDELQLRIFWIAAELCDLDSIVGLVSGTLIPQDAEWRERAFVHLVAPPDAVTALVDVVALNSGGLGLLHVDDFRLIPGSIFSDGFESGDTSAW